MPRHHLRRRVGAGVVDDKNPPSHAIATALPRKILQHQVEARCAIVGADHDVYGWRRRHRRALFRHLDTFEKRPAALGIGRRRVSSTRVNNDSYDSLFQRLSPYAEGGRIRTT